MNVWSCREWARLHQQSTAATSTWSSSRWLLLFESSSAMRALALRCKFVIFGFFAFHCLIQETCFQLNLAASYCTVLCTYQTTVLVRVQYIWAIRECTRKLRTGTCKQVNVCTRTVNVLVNGCAVHSVPAGVQALLHGHVLPAARQPRVPPPDRVLHVQAGDQGEVRALAALPRRARLRYVLHLLPLSLPLPLPLPLVY